MQYFQSPKIVKPLKNTKSPKSTFVPSVISTSKLNLTFGGSSMKTPAFTARKSTGKLNTTISSTGELFITENF